MSRDAAFGLWVAIACIVGMAAVVTALLLGANPVLCFVLLLLIVLSAVLALLFQMVSIKQRLERQRVAAQQRVPADGPASRARG
jgi:uncharacterized protein (DUF58 family)